MLRKRERGEQKTIGGSRAMFDFWRYHLYPLDSDFFPVFVLLRVHVFATELINIKRPTNKYYFVYE